MTPYPRGSAIPRGEATQSQLLRCWYRLVMMRRRTALAVSVGLAAAAVYAVKQPVWVRFWAEVSFVLGSVPLRLMGMVGALIFPGARARGDDRLARSAERPIAVDAQLAALALRFSLVTTQ
jgi:hypothetical protein